jgi:hypothetical protein
MQLAAASVMKEVGEWLKVTFRRKGVQVKSKVVKLFELFGVVVAGYVSVFWVVSELGSLHSMFVCIVKIKSYFM